MPQSPFTIKTIHKRVARYLKRQSKPMQQRFWDALAQICQGPFPSDNPAHVTHLKGAFHCSYRYALSQGRQAKRIKYDINSDTHEITVYDFGPRGQAYKRR